MNQNNQQTTECKFFTPHLAGKEFEDFISQTQPDFISAIGGSTAADKENTIKEGEMIKGRVVAIDRDIVLVDAGLKAEARVPKQEFGAKMETLQVDDEFDFMLEAFEDNRGNCILSRIKAAKQLATGFLLKNKKVDDTVKVTPYKIVKGGLMVKIDPEMDDLEEVAGFMPNSQIGTAPINATKLAEMLGSPLEASIINISSQNGATNIILSRRKLLEAKQASNKERVLEQLQEGMVVRGTVKNIVDFGVFVQLDDHVDGLLHISDMSWKRESGLTKKYNIGDEIDVMIVSIDKEQKRVRLGVKQMEANPFEDIAEFCPIGYKVEAQVKEVSRGIIAEVNVPCDAEGNTVTTTAFLHKSEISYTNEYSNLADFANYGDKFEAVISQIDPERARINLSVKDLGPNPWLTAEEVLPKESIQEGSVDRIDSYGIIVKFPHTKLTALVRWIDVDWLQDVNQSNCSFKQGDNVKLKIQQVDGINRNITGSIKHLTDNLFEEVRANFPVNSDVTFIASEVSTSGLTGIIKEIDSKFVARVALRDVLKLAGSMGAAGGKINEVVKPGTEMKATISNINEQDKQIEVTLKDTQDDFSSSNQTS